MVVFQGTLDELASASKITFVDVNVELDDEVESFSNCLDIIQAEDAALDLDEQYIVDDQTTEQEDTTYRPDFASMAKEASEDVIVKSTRDEYEQYVYNLGDH